MRDAIWKSSSFPTTATTTPAPPSASKSGGFLKNAGYRLTTSLVHAKDIVLPTAGMESWVEIHNSPSETEHLVQLLSGLKGVDVLTAQAPDLANHFIVMNAKGERAQHRMASIAKLYRYSCGEGQSINYLPVVEALSKSHQLDSDGFATADAWMAATLEHRYPVALERIARAHTRGTLNPATILISLDNHYLHAGWLVKKASELVWFGGTHGALDDLNSNGILLSNFAPTQDTSEQPSGQALRRFPRALRLSRLTKRRRVDFRPSRSSHGMRSLASRLRKREVLDQ